MAEDVGRAWAAEVDAMRLAQGGVNWRAAALVVVGLGARWTCRVGRGGSWGEQ